MPAVYIGYISNSGKQLQYILIDGINPNDLKKQKIPHFPDKLLLTNMAASSGLRKNVYPIIFLLKNVDPYNIIMLLHSLAQMIKPIIDVVFSGTDVNT